jgi:hypothetical protein
MPWPLIAAAGISAVGGIISSLASGGDDGPDYPEPVVLPKTVSGNVVSDMDFLFDIEAHEAMQYLTTQMNDWAEQDRDFFQNTFVPFQESLIQTNQALLPDIVKNSSTALKQNLKDMMGSEFLKESFTNNALAAGGEVGKFASDFAQMVDEIPSADVRVGQAISQVEQRFGAAGAELKRAMGAKGLDVSEASTRELTIAKAGAKAGATGVAREAARREALDATTQGVGVMSNVQQSQSNLLAQERGLTQAGANLLPQVGGIQETQSVGAAGEIAGQLTTSMSEKILGQTSEVKQAEFTQPGIVTPRFFDKETGTMVDAAGNEVKEIAAPVAGGTVTSSFQNNFRRQQKKSLDGGGPGVGTGMGSDSGATGGVGVGPGGGPGGQGAAGGGAGAVGGDVGFGG